LSAGYRAIVHRVEANINRDVECAARLSRRYAVSLHEQTGLGRHVNHRTIGRHGRRGTLHRRVVPRLRQSAVAQQL